LSTGYESRKLAYLRNFRELAKQAKELILKMDPEAIVYVFGSVVSGRYTGGSDIDLLVVSRKKEELEYPLKLNVYRKMLDVPLEMHVATPEEFSNWYLRFIKPSELLEI
jgi:uncharacterized protein